MLGEVYLQSEIKRLMQAVDEDIMSSLESIVVLIDNYSDNADLKLRAIVLGSELSDLIGKNKSIKLSEKERVSFAKGAIALLNELSKNHVDEHSRLALEKVRNYFISKRSSRIVYEAIGVSKDLGDFSIKPISFQLRLGEITSVVGKNGHGKSTLLKMVAGEFAVDKGQYNYFETFESKSANWQELKQKIAYIPQTLYGRDGTVPIKQILNFTASIKGILGKSNEEAVEFVLVRLGLKKFESYSWNKLSSGFKLRFELARQLVWSPQLLIMDEPLAHLDVKTQKQFLNDLRNLTNSLQTPFSVILSSQNIFEIEEISDNIIFLNNGEATYNGPVNDIVRITKQNRFLLTVDCDVTQLKSALSAISSEIEDISKDQNEIILTTSLAINSQKLILEILQFNITIKYFRDISNSTRIFFENE